MVEYVCRLIGQGGILKLYRKIKSDNIKTQLLGIYIIIDIKKI